MLPISRTRYCRVIAHEYYNPVPVIYIGLYVLTENTDLVNFFLKKKCQQK